MRAKKLLILIAALTLVLTTCGQAAPAVNKSSNKQESVYG